MNKSTLLLCAVFLALSPFSAPAEPIKPVSSTVLESARVFRNTATVVSSVEAYNSSASTIYIFIFDAATIPADGSLAGLKLLQPPVQLPSKATMVREWEYPAVASAGLVVVASTTDTTKTLATAVCRFSSQFQ